MKDNFKKVILDYLTSEIDVITSPSTGNQLVMTDFDDSFRLLFNLLEYNISYTDLDRIEESFEKNISAIIGGNLNDFPDAIEKLAANYEALLKKIAFLKYRDTAIWNGSTNSKGLKGTMFFDLCYGKIDGKPKLDIPEPLVDNTGIKKEILDFVRINLRNAVHISKTYKRAELIPFANLVLSCYLFTALDNKKFLKRIFYLEYKYLDNIVSNKDLNGLEKIYVELLGQDSNEKIDIMGKQIKDEYNLLSEIERFSDEQTEISDDEEIYIDNISNIVRDNKNLLLIGSPGSGKSTTLKKILYSNSNKILNGDESLKFPFYIEASELRTANKTIKSILDSKLEETQITSLLEKGRLQVLIDGINEIIPEYKAHAINEIKSLISKYPNSSFIITDRKYNYTKNIGVSVFELRDLEENQIREFIDKNAKDKSLQIWQNISENEEMLALASNPLMLKMYLSVISFGEIPSNRGQLYDLFIKTLFVREEQKKKQFDKDLKKIILSEVAYNMRLAGIVSADKSFFNKLIDDAIKRNNFQIAEILFYKEVLDNNIIKENDNNEMSFLHETYQEYFCALHLKHSFFKTGNININLADLGWIEPLLLCNDLFNKETEQLLFFEYLFVGQKEKNPPKPIKNFVREDYNPNIHIACKIANKHKLNNNSVFNTAVMYLGNYTVLSKNYFLSHREFPISISNLFNAISSLGSQKILDKIFTNPFWVEQWLYCEADEENYWNRTIKKDNCHKENFKHLANTIIDNSTDFVSLLNTVAIAEKENIWFKSVIGDLKFFKRNLLQSITLKKLIEYYENIDFEIDIFINILKQESSFIHKYNFQEHTKEYNLRVLETLSKYHHSKPEIRLLVINELKNNIYKSNIYWKIAKLFFDNNHFDSFMLLCEYIYSRSFDILNNILPLLQRISYNSLPNQLKEAFVENPDNTIIGYDNFYSKGDKIFQTIDACYSIFFESIIRNKSSILINNLYEISPIRLEPILNTAEYIITAKPINPNEFKVSDKGGVIKCQSQNISLKFEFLYSKLSSKGDKINFSLSPIGFSQPSISVGDEIIVNEKIRMQFVSFSTRNNEAIKYQIVSDKIENNIPNSGFLNIKLLLIDFTQPYKYHPDRLKTDFFIKNIRRVLAERNSNHKIEEEFIKNVGLSYLFYDLLKTVRFGVVVSIYRNLVNVFIINTGSFKEISCTENEMEAIELNSSVIVENNGHLSFFDHKKADFNIGFIESEIIEIFSERREGFIRNDGNNSIEGSDYFFHFDNCSFVPQIGDSVKFIPSINPSKNYQNLPVAILIEKLERPKCKIVELIQEDFNSNLRGIANDILTGEELFFSISEAAIYYIKEMDGTKLHIDQNFEYSIYKEAEGQFKKHIKLMKKIN